MSNVAKLKKQAAEYELKKQFDKALAIYVKLLDSFDEYADELDVALFNRVGDLMLRQGSVADAVEYYDRAVDRYADTGFFNNAIALCNKILRHSPGRALVYYKLGRISALKGFKSDAKVNFLEYADRMQKAGKVDEAFRALKEFADLCPDQDEIRLMLADQLTKAGRKEEAIEQLQTLYERYETEGRSREASATAERIHSIDPAVELRSATGVWRKSNAVDLVFLDLDEPSPGRNTPTPTPPRPTSTFHITPSEPPATPTPERTTPVVDFLPLTREHATPAVNSVQPTPERTTPTVIDVTPTPTPEHAAPVVDHLTLTPERTTPVVNNVTSTPVDNGMLTGITRIGDDTPAFDRTPTESVPGLELTRLGDDELPPISQPDPEPLLDIEATSLELTDSGAVQRSDTPTHGAVSSHSLDDVDEIEDDLEDGGSELEFILPDDEPAPARHTPSIDFDSSNLTTPPIASPATRPSPHTTRVALEGLPLMDLDVPPIKPLPPRLSTPLGGPALPGDLELIEDPDAPTSADEPEDVRDLEIADAFAEPAVDASVSDDAAGLAAAAEATDADMADVDDATELLDLDEQLLPAATIVAAQSVELLRARLEADPSNWGLRREMAEAMLDAGDRSAGIRELESAMTGADHAGNLDLASSIAEEVARLEPDVVRHHQKRVEYAFRTNDRARLIEAYLSLADALMRCEQPDKSRTVYQRVLDLAPDEARARAALDTIAPPEPVPAPTPAKPSSQGRVSPVPPAAESPRARAAAK